ncbi:MAG: adenylosuccinate synthetase, partial [Acidobacteriales bacterium]|nr:adenylosuccinate synthetase [Terriglobales bacterium]
KLMREHITNACREKNTIVHALYNKDPLDPDAIYAEYAKAAERIAPFVTDGAVLLNRKLREGGSIMFEGAQGTMLDIDHGTYPFVTSSSATSGGAVTGTGVAPNAIGHVIGVTKAYCTRVGEGPFPTEIHDAVGDVIRKKGNEFGAVTGRPRRCGWVDLPLLRYAQMINGVDWWVVTKMDVLDELEEVPVCVAWRLDGKVTEEVPSDARKYEKIECVYERLPGWRSATTAAKTFDQLPQRAQEYLRFLEKQTGATIGMVSTGPDRDETMMTDGFRTMLSEMHS